MATTEQSLDHEAALLLLGLPDLRVIDEQERLLQKVAAHEAFRRQLMSEKRADHVAAGIVGIAVVGALDTIPSSLEGRLAVPMVALTGLAMLLRASWNKDKQEIHENFHSEPSTKCAINKAQSVSEHTKN